MQSYTAIRRVSESPWFLNSMAGKNSIDESFKSLFQKRDVKINEQAQRLVRKFQVTYYLSVMDGK